ANNTSEFTANIRAGNERVLKARLADAAFFYREDRKTTLEEKTPLLKNIVFQEGLGSLWEKTLRIRDLAGSLGKIICLKEEEEEILLRAAMLSKADLVTSMVYEFPELQGVMGREYALASGEKDGVAAAIYEHYLPRFAGDVLPVTLPGAILSLVDKLDNITAAYMLGKEPTGSQDPLALRRQALGIVHILSGWEFALDLKGFLGQAYDRLDWDAGTAVQDRAKTVAAVWDFILQRIKYVLLDKGLRYDVVDAILTADCRDVRLIINRVHVLQKIIGEKFLQDLLIALTRVANLAAKAPENSRVDPNLLEEKEEKDLYQFFLDLVTKEEEKLAAEDFQGFLALGASIMPYVNNFFDQVMVMVEDARLRQNRLALLSEINTFFRREVDLSKIVQPQA
ncbi:MAG TPA: glycine--tRNA ligase subunit beta, partial [Firmicutes bacterium]|nr:glycine--tRNA ligase subunit beta [Bacillota bacterium]